MKLSKFLLYMSGVFSTMYLFSLKSIPFTLIFAFLYSCLYLLRKCNHFSIKELNLPFLLFILSAVITGVLNRVLWGRKFMIVPIYVYAIILLFFYCISSASFSEAKTFVKGLKLSCVIHVMWCIIQFGAYTFMKLDINKIVFVDILGLVQNASRIQDGKLILSGLCFHPSNLVPTLMLTVFLFDKWYVWAIVLLISVLSSSSTLIVCMSIAVMYKVIVYIRQNYYLIKINQKKVISATVVIFLAAFVFVKFDFYTVAKNKFFELMTRLTERSDASTVAHMSYYTRLPEIYSHFSILEKLFGWGIGKSGNVFTEYFGMYKSIGDWSIESDPMNFLYSVGIIGALMFYSFLILTMVKGWKVDRKTGVFIAILLVSGILYAVQYMWVVMLEAFFWAVLCRNKKVFESMDSKYSFSSLIKEILNEK